MNHERMVFTRGAARAVAQTLVEEGIKFEFELARPVASYGAIFTVDDQYRGTLDDAVERATAVAVRGRV